MLESQLSAANGVLQRKSGLVMEMRASAQSAELAKIMALQLQVQADSVQDSIQKGR